MQAETNKKASRVTCSSISDAPAATVAATGAKASRVCVETTPACLTGRMASM